MTYSLLSMYLSPKPRSKSQTTFAVASLYIPCRLTVGFLFIW